ncbi:twin-arginine translocation pathway signal [Alicycliphilus denitrificans]|uniref:NAD(P)/FAD-dependent oxidoreductase n=1 Tax=Alicycliphilus denitrificans TaxID=179636 RepID=UPI001F410E7C|nr:FAD/NAD(P)-binding oxidoreductase [Alicycliphilus denitrificans]BCN38949.1 twin-arginine translocation pathway signal [Alicycliphilus denitrificans]
MTKMESSRPRRAVASRRTWLAAAAGTGAALGMGLQPGPARAARLATKAHIVIAGSGLAGIAIAHRLHAMLDGARITIVDAKEVHNYQPGFTLVATGVWPVGKVIDRNADLQPAGVGWVKEMVAEFDPAANALVTTGGRRIAYDYLVVATGTHQDWAQIEGMDLKAIGSNGLASVYPSSDAAVATWAAMDQFRAKGGEAVLTLPATPLKCAGAPLKMTFMVRDRLAQAGTLQNSRVTFYSALQNVFGVKAVNDNVLERWQALGVGVQFTQKLKAIDVGARRATFTSPEGEATEVPYDFIHVVPPMRAPDAVKNSDLAWKDGPMAAGGWLEVDKDTLQHRRYRNVFGLGDINGTPRGKTAATVKKSAPLVAQHIVDVVAGREPGQKFDGYTSCPMIVREGSAMLIEFDYEGRLIPSLPMIEPLQESYFAWLMKVRMLKPAYMAVLKGRV